MTALTASGLFAALVSYAGQLGYFTDVLAHEPKNAPGNGLGCAIWWDHTNPVRSSGLAAVSAAIVFSARVYSNMLQEPQDEINPALMDAAHAFMGALAMNFTFGGEVRMMNLLGADGIPALSVRAGYITIGSAMYRAAELVIPVIVNDMWEESP